MIIKKKLNFEYEILECIRDNPGGLTITDIANLKQFSRNTVSKYVLSLETKKEIYKKKIGAYNLYFSSKKTYIPKITIISYYKALLMGLKDKFPNKEEVFKKIGHEYGKHIEFVFGPNVLKQLKSLSRPRLMKYHLEALRIFYSAYDIFQPDIEISVLETDMKNQKVIYRFKNSVFLENTEEFIYHIYISVGIIEGVLTRKLNIPVECNVIKINVGNNKENSYFDISIQIKK